MSGLAVGLIMIFTVHGVAAGVIIGTALGIFKRD